MRGCGPIWYDSSFGTTECWFKSSQPHAVLWSSGQTQEALTLPPEVRILVGLCGVMVQKEDTRLQTERWGGILLLPHLRAVG